MVTEPRKRIVPALDPNAEQVCLLDKDWADRRKESPSAFLDLARSQDTSEHSTVFHFESTPGMWDRMSTFVDEERECCRFFAFEQWEEDDEVLLRITRPERAGT